VLELLTRIRCRETVAAAADTSTTTLDGSAAEAFKSLLHVVSALLYSTSYIILLATAWPVVAQVDRDGPFFIYGFRPGMLILYSYIPRHRGTI